MLPLWTLIPGWVLTFVIVAGNAVVIFLIATRRNLRTTTNWFVLSLAVADLGFGAFYFPRYSSCWMYESKCVDEAVIVVGSIGYFFAYASVTNLCALTLDRYLAIVKPLRYVTFMTKKRVSLLVTAAWSVAVFTLIFCLKLNFAGELKDAERVFWLCMSLLSFLVCCFLLVTTARILVIVRRIAKQESDVLAQLNFNSKIHERVQSRGRDTASAKMLAIVVTIFAVCYFLDTIQSFREQGLQQARNETFDKAILPLLKLANSAVNPVAYALYKEEIRRELKQMCYKKRGADENTFRLRR